MTITDKQARLYLAACWNSYALADEYNNDEEAIFWGTQARKLEIQLKVAINERRPVVFITHY